MIRLLWLLLSRPDRLQGVAELPRYQESTIRSAFGVIPCAHANFVTFAGLRPQQACPAGVGAGWPAARFRRASLPEIAAQDVACQAAERGQIRVSKWANSIQRSEIGDLAGRRNCTWKSGRLRWYTGDSGL